MRWSFAGLWLLLAGCRALGCRAEGTEELVLSVDGVSRRLVVHRPPGGAQPLPLVLDLHGSGGTADSHAEYDGMDAVADAHGFLLVYPEGAIPLDDGYAWNVPGKPLAGGGAVPAGAQDDARFLAQAIERLRELYPVDPKRIYATGFSGGARMASELGCALPDVLAAVAPVAGVRFPDACASPKPMSVVAFHGTGDDVNPYDGVGDGYWTYGVPRPRRPLPRLAPE
jgi:polyhydroxybutyrate depolymerase